MSETIKINNKLWEYELDREDNCITVSIDGNSYRYEINMIGDGLYVKEGNRYIKISYFQEKDSLNLWADDAFYKISEESEEELIEEESEKDIKAPMPGIIKDVLVEAGQHISKGQTIVVLESMKMSNELKASVDGEIVEVHVAKGDQVDAFATLVRIESV